MADNVAITAGAGTNIASDDIGGVQYQRVKTTWGPDGTANDADVATGKAFPVQIRSATGLVPIGEPTDAKNTATDGTSVTAISIWKQISASVQTIAAGILALGRAATSASLSVVEANDREVTITFTPSCFAGALAANDVAFATEELANVVLVNGAQLELASIHASDISDLGAAIDLHFFNANTTLGTEDSAPDIDDTEVLTTISMVSILAADWKDLGANRVASINHIGAKMKAGAGTTSIWLGGVTQTAATFAAGTLQFQFTFVRK